MPTIPNRTRYASFGVAATIFEAADASKTYVRMPTSNATIEPRTTGTWYVGVCESSRHDWPNPASDFVRVASMVLSPPRLRPPMPGHMGIGTIFELWHRPDKDDVAQTVTKATTIPRSKEAVPTGMGIPQQKWLTSAATRFVSYDGGPSER